MSDNANDKPITTPAETTGRAVGSGISQFVQSINDLKDYPHSKSAESPEAQKNSHGINDNQKPVPNTEKAPGDRTHDKNLLQNNDGKQRESDKTESLDQMLNRLTRSETFDSRKEGMQKLKTGDKLVRGGNTEVLITPDGGTITVNKKDGSIELDSKETVKIANKNNTTTLTYPNGDTVEVTDGAIARVSRGNTVSQSDVSLKKAPEDRQPDDDIFKPRKPDWDSKPPIWREPGLDQTKPPRRLEDPGFYQTRPPQLEDPGFAPPPSRLKDPGFDFNNNSPIYEMFKKK